MSIRHAVGPMTYKMWPCEALRHYICQLSMGIHVGKVKNIFLAPVSDDMMADVYMLGPLRRHIVRGHVNAGFIVLVEKDRFSDTDSDFLDERT